MITKDALDFLHECRFRNSREWYHAHKEDYKKLVVQPLKELAERLQPTLQGIDPLLVPSVSRIYRDTRFAKDKTLYRDVMWFVFVRPKQQAFMSSPGFFFEMSPEGWRYGLGYYHTPAKVMAVMREMILAGDKLFAKAQTAYEQQTTFTLQGAEYKRNRYSDRPGGEQIWLNKRDIYLAHDSQDFQALYAEDLWQTLADGFETLQPIYAFMAKAEELAPVR